MGCALMGEHMFGVIKGKVSEREFKRVNRIARKHGAWFTGSSDIPGTGPQYWFACQNQGHPFDGATARAVLAEVGQIKVSR